MDIKEHLIFIRELRKNKNWKLAAEQIQEGLGRFPKNIDLAIEAAALEMDQGQFEQAIQKWSALTENEQNVPRGVFIRLSSALRSLGEHDKAHAALDELSKEEAERFDTIFERAMIEVSRSRWETSLFWSDKAMKAAKTTADHLLARCRHAISLAKLERFREARRTLGETIEFLESGNFSRRVTQAAAIIKYEEEKAAFPDAWARYWNQRADFVYIHVCKELLKIVAPSARVAADVGSNRTPMLDVISHVPIRYSIDPKNPYEGPGVIAVREDFLSWIPDSKVDLGMCFQVIEHVPKPDTFAKKMLEIFEVSIVSVPYKEPEGLNPGHINNDIDLPKIIKWFGRPPIYSYIARELSGDERIICVFDSKHSEPIINLSKTSLAAMDFRFRWSIEGAELAS